MVICSNSIKIRRKSLLDRLPFPERALSVSTYDESLGAEFEIISFHSLTGVDYKKAKSAQFAALVDYLHLKQGENIVLSCDLNEPKVDHAGVVKVEFFNQNGDKGKAASMILRPNGEHDLKDAYRLWLAANQIDNKPGRQDEDR